MITREFRLPRRSAFLPAFTNKAAAALPLAGRRPRRRHILAMPYPIGIGAVMIRAAVTNSEYPGTQEEEDREQAADPKESFPGRHCPGLGHHDQALVGEII